MEELEGGRSPDAGATCSWCGAAAAPEATQCGACGAALAQRESIGELLIPGLTSVDPALEDFDKRPLHLRGPSASQGMAPALIVGAMAGGPIGIAAIGGVAAVAAAEFLGAGGGGHDGARLENVGRPSEIVLQALEHLDQGANDTVTASADAEGEAAAATSPPADDGRSIWRDLPEEAGDSPVMEMEGIDGGG
jgi:hypothetical protein